MNDASKDYLPAAGRDWALPLYDPIVRLMGIERVWDALIDQAGIERRMRVLDIGCGTGGLVVCLKRSHREADVVGIDPDPRALARAGRKADAERLSIQLDRGFSDHMPYGDASFDRVLSSFMFHHLSRDAKIDTVREVRRVLRPGGSLHLVDFVGRAGPHGFLIRLFHSDRALADNVADRMIARFQEAGFEAAACVKSEALFLGHFHVNYYRATVPEAGSPAPR